MSAIQKWPWVAVVLGSGRRQGPNALWNFASADGATIKNIPIYPNERKPQCGRRFRHDGRNLVVVGLDIGIEVWDVDILNMLKAGDGRKALLRRFYGHDSQVSCLDVSPDAQWLVSGSLDGTICAWSLMNLQGRDLGVGVGQVAGRLIVKDIKPGSPGWEAGFEQGQQIVKVLVAGRKFLTVKKMKQALDEAIPGVELAVTVKAENREAVLVTPVSVDPLWTYYPQYDGYWTMWTPEGYFDEKPLRFGELYGAATRFDWQLSVGAILGRTAKQNAGHVVTMNGIDFENIYHNGAVLSDIHKSRTAKDRNDPPAATTDAREKRTTGHIHRRTGRTRRKNHHTGDLVERPASALGPRE
ncbi:MAG: hypothetical protein IIC90_00460 [Chloroflexi bacterium]|nr:hypothetical protein [Chloroflexota bacterium]